tara:strand:+ start:11016 stop:11951 length:936 start_codon:yes stop_codon:yes gene_type:complete
MVQLIGIQAKRLQKAMEDNQSTEHALMDQWSRQGTASLEEMAGFLNCDVDDVDPFIAKLVWPKARMGNNRDVEREVCIVNFIFRRKGAMYCQRENIHRAAYGRGLIDPYENLVRVWKNITDWVIAGEIEPDDDIVIYRTGGRRQARIHNKFPIRMKDNTYCILTGITEHLGTAYNYVQETDFDGYPVPTFDEWFGANVYQGLEVNRAPRSRRRFFYNGSQFIARARWVYHYLATYGHDLHRILWEMGVSNQRLNLLMWKGGKIRVWNANEQDPLMDGDHFQMLTYDDGHVKWNLQDSDYAWDSRDNQFIER